MSPLPASIADDFLERVNDLMTNAAQPSQFDMARLDMDIRNISNIDVALSQCFRGIYHALQGDLANTTKWFNMALSVNLGNPDIYMNYAASLCRLGQHEQAIKMALEAINKGNYTAQAIHNLLLSAYYADAHDVLDEWLPKYHKLTGNPHAIVTWLQEDAEDEAEIAQLRDEIRSGPYTSLDKIRKELGL